MTRRVERDDFQGILLVSGPQVAPNGGRVACTVRRIDLKKNRYLGQIWVADGDNPPRAFTGPDASSHTPRWSPDASQLAFLSDRQKPKSQIYLLPADGGEARALTHLEEEGSIEGLRWSPDGSQIAFLFRRTPVGYREEDGKAREENGASMPLRHHVKLNYRLDAQGYWDGEYSQIWIADTGTGDCRQLTGGDYNCQLPVWSPDGTTLAFLSNRRDDADITPGQDTIHLIAAAGGEIRPLPTPPGDKSNLCWSPDGTRFAYLGNPDVGDTWGTTNDRVFVLPSTGSETATDLTGGADLAGGYLTLGDSHEVGGGDALQWADADTLIFAGSAWGEAHLYRVGASGGKIECLTAAHHNVEVGDFHVGTGGRLAYTMGNAVRPHELYTATLPSPPVGEGVGGEGEPVSDFNGAWLSEVELVVPEAIPTPGLYGWTLKPAGLGAGETVPLVVYVHGGPHAQYGHSLFHELQWLAAQGYGVLYTNPRGSKGYGEAHTKAIIGAWGTVDYDDVIAATDYAVGLDWVDAGRTAIMGGSYGGFMTAWAVGHTDRFQCAIADRLVANLSSMAGTCDFAWLPSLYFAGNAWSDPAALRRHSPLAHAGNVTAPLLLIHSDGDLRCPAGQAEEMFAALRLQRKTVEYIRFPASSSHGLSRNGPPDLRRQRLQCNLDWLNRWLKPGQP